MGAHLWCWGWGVTCRHILTHAGKISHLMAKELAEAEYEKFSHQRIRQADAAGGDFEKAIQQLPPPPKPKRKGREEVKRGGETGA